MPDNVSFTDADLGALGGPHKAQAEFKGNSLVTLELSLGLAGTPWPLKLALVRVCSEGPFEGLWGVH